LNYSDPSSARGGDSGSRATTTLELGTIFSSDTFSRPASLDGFVSQGAKRRRDVADV